ncbi:MAG TPA: hypothetical protein VHR18_11215 [Solirubrobacterales bacterium]|jgi:hypothetical protein|nr:hypothetical protein [Solirubrobacterales bacterium]
MRGKLLEKLGLVAVVALGVAVIAAPAQALPMFTAESYPAKLKGQALEPQIFKFNASWKCKQVSLLATLTEASSTLNLAPEYSECTFFGLPVSAKTGGCRYELHLKEAIKEDEYKATFDVLCPKGELIEFNFSIPGGFCRWKFGEQTALSTVRVKNETTAEPAKDVILWLEISNIKYTTEGNLAECGANGTFFSGMYQGVVTLPAFDASSKAEGLWVA